MIKGTTTGDLSQTNRLSFVGTIKPKKCGHLTFDLNGCYMAYLESFDGTNSTVSIKSGDSKTYKLTVQGLVHNIKILPTEIDYHLNVITATLFGISRHLVIDNSSHDSHQISEFIGNINHISFNYNVTHVCICIEDYVEVIRLDNSHRMQFLKHNGPVLRSAFFTSHNDTEYLNTLISISEDKTFKIWDIEQKACIYQSSLLCSTPTSLSVDKYRPWIIIGFEDGTIQFYDLSPLKRLRGSPPIMVKSIDINSMLFPDNPAASHDNSVDVITSAPFWKLSIQDPETDRGKQNEIPTETVSHSNAILSIGQSFNTGTDHSGFMNFNQIIVGTRSHIITLDSNSLCLIEHFSPSEIFGLSMSDSIISHTLPHLDSTCILSANIMSSEIHHLELRTQKSQEFVGNSKKFISLSEFIARIFDGNAQGAWRENIVKDCILQLNSIGIYETKDLLETNLEAFLSFPEKIRDSIIDFISTEKAISRKLKSFLVTDFGIILSDSILSQESKIKVITKPPPSKKAHLEHPITYRSKIKSSGYTSTPIVTKMHTISNSKSLKKKTIPAIKKENSHNSLYETAYLSNLKRNTTINQNMHHTKSITTIKYSYGGSFLSTASSDQSIRCHKFHTDGTLSTKEFIGHNGTVFDLNYSMSIHSQYGALFISGSKDCTAKIWSISNSERPLITINSLDGDKSTFKDEVSNAQFYYQDKLLLLSNKDKICIYSYTLEKKESGSVKPGLNYNKNKCIKTYQSKTVSITSLKAMNYHTSNLIISATSDKSLHIWDVNRDVCLESILDAHQRVIHCVNMVDSAHIPESFDHLFTTSSSHDSIKIWDIRVFKRPVVQLSGHINRFASVKSCISPCGRYVLTGSEDNNAYMYDIRMQTVVNKFGGASDVINDVAMKPTSPEVVTACQDGKVRIFDLK